MKIISWNINNRIPLWEDVASLDADIALLQEAPPPPQRIREKIEIIKDGKWQTGGNNNRPWRTSIARLSNNLSINERQTQLIDSASLKDFKVSRKGTLSIANVNFMEESITLVSMYGTWEKPDSSASQSWILADASVHRLISDISSLIGTQKGHKIIAAGDLNILYGYGEEGSLYWKNRYISIFSRMKAIGMSFVGPQYPDGGIQANPWPEELPLDSLNVPTFRSDRKNPLTATRQLDFVFASDSLHPRINVKALNSVEEWGASDHCRILIEIK